MWFVHREKKWGRGSPRTQLGTVAGIILVWDFLRPTYVTSPPGPWFTGCYVEKRSTGIVLQSTYALVIFFELVVIILTIRKGYKDYSSGTPLLRVIYRDSIIFFLVLFTLTLSVFPVHMLAPPVFNGITPPVLRVTYCILCCRILLNIKGAASRAWDPTIDGLISHAFAATPGQGTNQAETIQLEICGAGSVEGDSCRHEDRDFVV